MKNLALTVAFLLELVAFYFFAGVAFVLDANKLVQILLAVVLFVALVVFWSLYMAPRATKKFAPLPYYAAKFCIYAVSAFSLLMLTNATYFAMFVIATVLDDAVLFRHNIAK